jgi:fructokinase
MIAAIEAGGTKFVCGAGRSWRDVRSGPKHVVPTTTPDETMPAVTEWLRAVSGPGRFAAIGVASFGPLDLGTGRISSSTPKREWIGFDWRSAFAGSFPGVPVCIDTDTNGAAMAEWRWGAARGCDVAAYVTVGTGIGGGVMVGGQPLHGLSHPELGHMRVPRHPSDSFEGNCPFHQDCLEGLASGPAIEARWGLKGQELPPGHPAWSLEAEYLAAAVVNIATVVAPEVMILGGGVLGVPGLLDSVRDRAVALLGGYAPLPRGVVIRPGLDGDSGLLGAFAIAQGALAKGHQPGPAGSVTLPA